MDSYNFLLYGCIFIVSYILTNIILRKFQNLPPTPFPTLPIIGHLHLLTNPTKLHHTLANLAKKHGPVLNLKFGSRNVLVVSSASAAIDCFHQNDVIFASRPKFVSGKILGYNFTDMIWAPYGPLWRNHRKIASTEILSPHRLQLLHEIRADEVKLLVQSMMDENADETVSYKTLCVKSALLEMTNNLMMRMIAGRRCYNYGVISDDFNEGDAFRKVFQELIDMGPPSSPSDFFPWLKYFGANTKERKFKEIFVKMDKYFQYLVDEKKEMQQRRDLDEGSNDASLVNKKTLIEVLLHLHDSDPTYFTDDMIKGLVWDLLLAGTETTASTMEWILSLLLNHPEVLQKAQREIDEYVGSNRLINEADIAHLPYLHCIIQESLRMYPATALLPPHESSSDCTVQGYKVKQGTILLVNIWAIQNDPSNWDEPLQFRPERFASVKEEKAECKFMPFGSGRRACPGENLAVRVVGLTLGTLLQCFDWKRVDDGLVDMEEIVGVTISKVIPLRAQCKPRSHVVDLLRVSKSIVYC